MESEDVNVLSIQSPPLSFSFLSLLQNQMKNKVCKLDSQEIIYISNLLRIKVNFYIELQVVVGYFDFALIQTLENERLDYDKSLLELTCYLSLNKIKSSLIFDLNLVWVFSNSHYAWYRWHKIILENVWIVNKQSYSCNHKDITFWLV